MNIYLLSQDAHAESIKSILMYAPSESVAVEHTLKDHFEGNGWVDNASEIEVKYLGFNPEIDQLGYITLFN